MGHFYFVRHGQTVWNVENKICGATDIALTELGHRQAIETGRRFLEQGLTADEIRQIAEEALDFQGTDRYLPLAGLAYDLYPNAAPGERVRNLRAADGTPLNGRRRIPVAFSSYQLAGSGGRYPVLSETLRRPSSRLEVKPASVRDLLEAYLRANNPLDLPSGHEARVFQRERRLWERRANFENALE